MVERFHAEIIARETGRPSTPTPQFTSHRKSIPIRTSTWYVAMCEGGQEVDRNMGNDAQDFCNCSSWCSVSQFYEADFGWGKPKWVTAPFKLNNIILLLDARDGKGIEMYLGLTEEDMGLVDTSEELLKFSSLNPPIN